MSRPATGILVLLLAIPPGSLRAASDAVRAAYRSDRILVQPKRQVPARMLQALHGTERVRVHRTFPGLGGLQVLEVPSGSDVPGLVKRYQQSGLVEFAEPDYLVRATGTVPNDPRYLDGTQWGLDNWGQGGGTPDADIDAPEAWDVRTSASNIVVAVLDTGILATHEDLAGNLWSNPLDGSHGWNALSGTNNPVDDHGHGTLVSGVLGAVGNNQVGIAGVAWQVQIMALKCLDSSGVGSDSDLVACIDYARTHGAHVINTSLDTDAFSLAVSNAIWSTREAGMLFVASAGNNAANLDAAPRYPSCYPIDNVISVAATTRTDSLWSFSNTGATNVDLAAPGHQIHSTFFLPQLPYLTVSGTSMAAPFVAGTLALLRAKYPWETHTQIIQRLLAGVDPVPDLAGRCASGGRLNLREALRPTLRLEPLATGPGTPFGVRVRGGPNRVFVIQATADLEHWTALEINITNPEGYHDFLDAGSPAAPVRFYRALAEP